MSNLEVLLRLSAIQAEMIGLADALGPEGAKIVKYAARVLNLLKGRTASPPKNRTSPPRTGRSPV